MTLLHNISKPTLEELEALYARPSADAKGNLVWVVDRPEWLQLLFDVPAQPAKGT